MSNDDKVRILMSRATANRMAAQVSRRGFLGLTGAAATAAFLAACGGSSSSETSIASDSTAATSYAKKLNFYAWAEYDDPDLMKKWGDIQITVFNSNEEAIQKLAGAKGTGGFDILTPTGPYIPQLVKQDLLEPLDLSRITNFSNIETVYTNQSWDPGNKYSVCKDWGSTGWIYDTTQVKTPINSWSDFIKVAQTEASGNTSVLDAPPDLLGIYFWANGIDWTTEKKEDLDAAENFMVNQFAKHIKAFDSFPGINLTQGQYALSQVFNGDARQGLLSLESAGQDPARYKWGLGSPATELWMDNWCIPKGAKNVDAAYDWINYILEPANSLTDVKFHGYHTGIKGIEDLAGALKYKEMVFFSPDQVSTMHSGAINSAQDRMVQIYNNVKAKAGG